MYTKIITACFLILSTLSFTQNIPSYVPKDGLVGYWPFNGNANDESGNGNNGTVNGAIFSLDRFGNSNQSALFSSNTSQYIATNIGIQDTLTFSFWYKCNSQSKYYPTFIDYGNSNSSNLTVNNRYVMHMAGQEPSWINTYTGKVFNQTNIPDVGLFDNKITTDDKWHQMVSIYVPNDSVYLYVDGIKIGAKSISNVSITDGTLYFGRDITDNAGACSSCGRYNGLLDDIAIYNRALSKEEITALFTGNAITTIPSYVPKNGLVGYWPFNGNANDESGNGNNGTVNGATLTADRNGIANSAYNFDGFTNHIQIAPSTTLNNFNNEITISAWVFSRGSSGNASYGNQDLQGIFGPATWLINDGGFMFRLNDPTFDNVNNRVIQFVNGMPGVSIYSSTIVKTGAWENIVCTYNGNILKIFRNGILSDSLVVGSGLTSSLYTSGRYYTIGQCIDWSSTNVVQAFNGQLDDIAIYNRALSQQEITSLYYSGTPALASTNVFVDTPASVNENENVEVSISTEALNSADNVIAFQTDLSYDTTRYTFVSNNLTGTLNPAGKVAVNSTKNGKLNISYMTQTALNGAGSLVKLTFKANKTLGKGIFSLSNFLYNTTAVTSLKSDTVNTLDVTPPSARILYSQNPVRKGDSLLITVKYSEKMAVTPIPQFSLSGQNTLANSNLTKVNDTTYTYWWVVEKGNGAVQVTLATGKDIAGNSVIATPTQNASFTVLPTLFGDIDTNKLVQAYDAALALQYSVGLNPLPTMDALPWSNWRIVVANVDTVGNVTANDASLILQHSAKLITTFPADAKKRGDAPAANITVTQEANQLVFRATGTLYAFNVFMKDNFNAFGQPEVKDKNAMVATNISATTYNVGLASTTPFAENEPFLVIPIITNENVQGTMDIVANTQEKALAYGAAASIAINQNDALVVYPNPTKDVITIHNAQGKTVKIVDVQGKEVYNAILPSTKTEISLKGLGAKGIYMLHIADEVGNSIQNKKIILE